MKKEKEDRLYGISERRRVGTFFFSGLSDQ